MVHKTHEETESVPRTISQEMTIKAQFHCRCLREGRRPMSSSIPVEFPPAEPYGLDSKDSKYRSCKSTNSPLHDHLCWKIRFKNQVTTCSDFPSEAMLWIEQVEMVDSLDAKKSS